MLLIIINGLLLVIATSALTALRFVHRNTIVEKTNLAAQLIVEKEKVSLTTSQYEEQREETEKYKALYLMKRDDWYEEYRRANKLEKVLEEAALRY